jgi:hypothetical protein
MRVLRVCLRTFLTATLLLFAAAASPAPAKQDTPAASDRTAAGPADPAAAAPGPDAPLPELARRRIDAALADLDTGHFADIFAGLLVLHAAGDPARARAMVNYAAGRAPQAQAVLAHALRLADIGAARGRPAPSAGPATEPAGTDDVPSASSTLRPPRGRLATPQFR